MCETNRERYSPG